MDAEGTATALEWRTVAFADAWVAQVQAAHSPGAVRALLLAAGHAWLPEAVCDQFRSASAAVRDDPPPGTAGGGTPGPPQQAEAYADGNVQLLTEATSRPRERLEQEELPDEDILGVESRVLRRAAACVGPATDAAWAALTSSGRFASVAECLLTGARPPIPLAVTTGG